MKKLILATLIFFNISFNSFAANRYWISSSGSNWNNTANWSTSSGGASGASVPSSSDIVYFDANGTGICTLDMNATVIAMRMSASTLNTSTYTFTINGTSNSTFSGGTINGNNTFNIHPTGSARVTFSGTTFNPAVDVISPRIFLNGSTFNSTSSFEKTSSSNDASIGGNTFVGNCTIKNSGSNYLMLGNGGDDSFTNNLDIINSGSNTIYIAYNNSTTTIGGNLIVTNSGSATDIGISYNGTSSVTVSGNCTVSGNTSVISKIYLGNNGSFSVSGNLDITNNGTSDAYIYLANNTSSSSTITGNTTVNNNGDGPNKRIYLGNNGDVIFNGTLSITNNSSADNSRVYLNNTSNSNNQYNENIVLEVTNASCNGIYFGNSGGSGTIAPTKTLTIGGAGFIAGNLYLRNFTQSGATNQSLTTTGTSIILNRNSSWDGNISFTAPGLRVFDSSFSGTAHFEKTGASDNNSSGGNTFMGNVTFINSGSGYLRFGAGTPSDFQADVTLTNSGSNDLIIARQGAGHSIAGNLSITNSGNGSKIAIADNINSTLTIGGNTTVVNNGSGTEGSVHLGKNGDVTFSGDIDISNSSTADNSMIYIGDNTSNSNIIINGNLLVENTNVASDGIDINCNTASLATGKTISIKAGGFIAGAFTIENLTQNGTTAQSIELSSNAYLQLRNNNWDAAVTFKAPKIYLRNSTYNGVTYIEKTGATNDNCYGGNTFKENTEIVNSGSAQLIIAYSNPDIYEKDLKLTNSGTNSLYFSNNAAGTQVQGNLIAENKNSAINLFIANNSSSSVTISGTSNISNTSTAATSAVYYGNNGDVTANGNCTFLNNPSGNEGSIYLAQKETSAVNITGDVSITNQSGGTNKRIYIGNNGDVIINGTLSIENASSANNSQIFCNYNGNSSNQYNGNITITSNTAGCDGVYFGSKTGSSTLANGYTISASGAGFSEGTLFLRNFTQNGLSAQNISLTGNSYLSLYSSTWNGNTTFSAPDMFLRTSTFNGTASFDKTGSSNRTSHGGNIFNAATTIKNSGTAFFRLANNLANDYNADVTFIKSNSGSIVPAYSTQSTFAGNVNLDINSLFYIGGTATGWIEFDGTAAQSFNNIGASNTIRIRRLLTNNSADEITLNTPIQIVNNLNLTNGNIITTSTNILRINNDAVVDAVSDNAYVDGPVVKYGDDAFVFPVGGTDSYGNSHYAGIGISAPSATNHSFTAQYYAAGHGNATTFAAPLTKVSLVEYWDLNRTNGSSTVDVSLLWGNGTRSGIGNLSDLRLSHWNGAIWEDMGNDATTGAAASGSITANGISSFSPFTIATVDNTINPLPIDLLDFKITKYGNTVHINWATASETNNDYFIIERTSDFSNIKKLGVIKGAGNSNSVIKYSLDDNEPLNGTSYYRLTQVDFDGSKEVFDWKAISFNININHEISIYPNPSTDGDINISISNFERSVKIDIVDIGGRVIYSSTYIVMQEQIIIPLKLNFKAGIYFIKVTDNDTAISKKFIVK